MEVAYIITNLNSHNTLSAALHLLNLRVVYFRVESFNFSPVHFVTIVYALYNIIDDSVSLILNFGQSDNMAHKNEKS